VQGDSMLPLYRDGDILIVEPGAQIRRGDRVVVRSREGEVMAKVLNRQTPRSVELISINPDHPNRSFDVRDRLDRPYHLGKPVGASPPVGTMQPSGTGLPGSR
jgi:phage repressor protein C with HTH and peptisase S24 domain